MGFALVLVFDMTTTDSSSLSDEGARGGIGRHFVVLVHLGVGLVDALGVQE